jgi:hypothetical protein
MVLHLGHQTCEETAISSKIATLTKRFKHLSMRVLCRLGLHPAVSGRVGCRIESAVGVISSMFRQHHHIHYVFVGLARHLESAVAVDGYMPGRKMESFLVEVVQWFSDCSSWGPKFPNVSPKLPKSSSTHSNAPRPGCKSFSNDHHKSKFRTDWNLQIGGHSVFITFQFETAGGVQKIIL